MSKRILILEDETALSGAAADKLEREGFDATVVPSVKQGLEVMEKQRFDAIWLDHYLLGKETGLDFVGAIKENNDWKDIPIYVVSNTAGPDKVQTYLQLGVKEYYIKAKVRLDEVIEHIKQTT